MLVCPFHIIPLTFLIVFFKRLLFDNACYLPSRNLLPYELYAAGLDYSTALPKADKEKKKSPENVMKDKNPKRRNSKESSVVEKKPRRPSKEYSVVQLNTKDNGEIGLVFAL